MPIDEMQIVRSFLSSDLKCALQYHCHGLFQTKKVMLLKVTPIYRENGNREPYKSGYRGVSLSK